METTHIESTQGELIPKIEPLEGPSDGIDAEKQATQKVKEIPSPTSQSEKDEQISDKGPEVKDVDSVDSSDKTVKVEVAAEFALSHETSETIEDSVKTMSPSDVTKIEDSLKPSPHDVEMDDKLAADDTPNVKSDEETPETESHGDSDKTGESRDTEATEASSKATSADSVKVSMSDIERIEKYLMRLHSLHSSHEHSEGEESAPQKKKEQVDEKVPSDHGESVMSDEAEKFSDKDEVSYSTSDQTESDKLEDKDKIIDKELDDKAPQSADSDNKMLPGIDRDIHDDDAQITVETHVEIPAETIDKDSADTILDNKKPSTVIADNKPEVIGTTADEKTPQITDKVSEDVKGEETPSILKAQDDEGRIPQQTDDENEQFKLQIDTNIDTVEEGVKDGPDDSSMLDDEGIGTMSYQDPPDLSLTVTSQEMEEDSIMDVSESMSDDIH